MVITHYSVGVMWSRCIARAYSRVQGHRGSIRCRAVLRERGYEGTREEGMCLGGECEVVAAEARVPNSAVAATPGRAA